MKNYLACIYRDRILTYPAIILFILVCILIFFSLSVKNFKLDASADSLLLEDDKDLRIFRDLIDRYQTKEFLFVTFSPTKDLFSDESIQLVRKLRDELAQLEPVESVVSIIDVPLVRQFDGKLSDIARNYRTLESEDVNIEKARQGLTTSPIFSQLIISEDGQTTALQINLKDNQEFKELLKQKNTLSLKKRKGELTEEEKNLYKTVLERYDVVKTTQNQLNHEMVVTIREIMDQYKQYGTLHLGGVPMITDDMITFIKNDLIVFGLGVFIFLVIMLSVIFRQKRWVILPLISCIYAGLLMIGLLGYVGWRVTVISSNFISLMLIITMSMNVHLIVRYRQLRQDYPEKSHPELVNEMAGKMVWPCLYTALTTIMAFGSLVVSDIKPVIDFGWMMTIGLTVTFLTTFLLFPALLVLLGKSEIHTDRSSEYQFTNILAGLTERHGNKVLFISILLAVISATGISRLEVENSFIDYFSDETEIYQGLKLIDQKIGGTTPLDVLIKFEGESEETIDHGEDEEFEDFDTLFGGTVDEDPADYWFTPDKVEQVKHVHDYIDSLPAVGKVLSLASIIRVGEQVNKGTFDAFELAIVYKRMPQELKSSMIDPYISIENNEARINARIVDSLENLRRNEFLKQLHNDIVEKLGIPEDRFQITGLLVLYNNMLQSLFRSQILTLGVVMAGIFLMLVVLFRSISLAIIGIIPNLLAAAIILGLMGLLRIPLDMMTITIAAITIGIAVDNSIHYIYRFREEYVQKQDYIKTLHYCHANIGKAVFYTATIIIIGFSILVLSNFIPTIYFGVLTALAMLIALLAALTLLPKLILIWKPF